jgi:4a-hydroxytetrahydrobiopterin dehydratase
VSRLTDAEIERALTRLPGWSREGDAIVKWFDWPSFPEAVAFTMEVAFAAEAADHHPEITISYRRVRLAYTTHSERGLTGKDVDGALAVEAALVP